MEDTQLLIDLNKMVNALESTNSVPTKVRILKQYISPDTIDLLSKIYNPLYLLYITGDNICNYLNVDLQRVDHNYSIFKIFDMLNRREITGNKALSITLAYIKNYPEHTNLIINIFNKDLRCGIGIKTINKAFNNIIPEFNIPLAKKFSLKQFNFDNYKWYISRKLDGIRCLCFITNGEVEFYSRYGKKIYTLDTIGNELKKLNMQDIILDGELCIYDKDMESFHKLTTMVRRKNYTIENPTFFVFDCYSIEDFTNNIESNTPYSIKYSALKDWLKNLTHTKLLEQKEVESKSHLLYLHDNFPSKWEGLILRRGDKSVFKRSYSLMKIKNFVEDDFKVYDIETGIKKIEGIDTLCISNLIIHYKGERVSVGSGISDVDRIVWYSNPDKILNKIITVKYFTESENKTGRASLKWPTFKCIRDYE